MITYWLLYGTIVFYSIVDAVQTKMLLDMGATELNPVLNYFIDGSGGVYAIFAFKAFWLILMFILLVFKSKETRNQYYKIWETTMNGLRKDQITKMAQVLIDHAIAPMEGDYIPWCFCSFCDAELHGLRYSTKDLKHDTGCPVLIAKEVLKDV